MENGELKISRNAPCPCGSGKKYKLCCGAKAVAEERAAEERKSPFYRAKVERPKIEVPEGVTVERDDTRIAWPNNRPKWRTAVDLENEDETGRIIDKLVRPYFEKYCHGNVFEEGAGDEIAVVEASGFRGHQLGHGPTVVLGRYGQLWDILGYKIDEAIGDCRGDGEYTCEVRWDHMFGCPIISLLGSDDAATFLVTSPNHWEKMRAGEDDWE